MVTPEEYSQEKWDEEDDAWERMVKELEEEQKEDVKSEFDLLETMTRYMLDERSAAWMMSGIVGVYADVKPVAFEEVFDDLVEESDARMVQESLRRLGIATEVEVDRDADENGIKRQTWYFAKQPELITEFREVNRPKFGLRGEEKDATERKVGKLLGYPETATEYFIRRSHSDDPYSEEPGSEHYIHSPEHAAEEYEQYEKPLYAAMAEYCPESLKVLLGNKEA